MDGNQPFYGLIDSIEPAKLEILKGYLKTHLKTRYLAI